jgi:hypothetical protein
MRAGGEMGDQISAPVLRFSENKILREKENMKNNNKFSKKIIFSYAEYIRAISKRTLKRLKLKFVSQFSGFPQTYICFYMDPNVWNLIRDDGDIKSVRCKNVLKIMKTCYMLHPSAAHGTEFLLVRRILPTQGLEYCNVYVCQIKYRHQASESLRSVYMIFSCIFTT